MLCGILAKTCILGKFHPQPSSLGKHSFIRLMRIPRASKDCLTCDLGCASLTQHSNDKYNFRQFLIFFKEIVLSFISFHNNFCPEWVCMTQSTTKQLPTCLDLHILVQSVIPFRIDMRRKSLSLCCSAFFTKQRCTSSNHRKIGKIYTFLTCGQLNITPKIAVQIPHRVCLLSKSTRHFWLRQNLHVFILWPFKYHSKKQYLSKSTHGNRASVISHLAM